MDIIYNGNSVDALFAVYQLIKAETVYSLEDIVLHPVSANISTWPSVKGSIQENIVWIVGTGATSDILSFWTKHCPGAMIIENHPNAKKYFDCAPEKFVKYDTEVSVSYLMHHYLANSEEEDIEDTPPYVAFLDKITMWRGEITLEDRVLREAFHNHEIMCRSLTNKSELMALLDKFVIAFTCHRDEVLSTYYHVVVNRDMAMNKMIETIGKITTITDENVGKWKLPRGWVGEKVFTMDTSDCVIDSTDTSWLVFQKYPDVNIYANFRLKGFNAFQYSVRVREGADHIDLTEGDNPFYGRKHSAGLYRKMMDTGKLGPMPFI
jgi:hypothetical protein